MSESPAAGQAKTFPDPIPASLYARPAEAHAKASPNRTWYRWIPGFRTGKRWKEVLAVIGYVPIAAWLVQTPSNPKLGLFGVLCLGAVGLATNAGGVRSRVAVLRSGNPFVAGIGWIVIAIVLIAVGAWEQPPTGPPSQSASPIVASTPPGSPAIPTATQPSSPTPSAKPTPTPTPTPTPKPTPTPSPAAPAQTPITFCQWSATSEPGADRHARCQNFAWRLLRHHGQLCFWTFYRRGTYAQDCGRSGERKLDLEGGDPYNTRDLGD